MKSSNKLSPPFQSHKNDLTLPTEQDLTLQFSKDDSFFLRPMSGTMLKNENTGSQKDVKIEWTYECNSNSSGESTLTKIFMRNSKLPSRKIAFTQDKDQSDEYNQYADSCLSFKLEKQQQGDNFEGISESKSQQWQEDTSLQIDSNEYNLQLSGEQQLSQKQDQIRKKMKQLDNSIRMLQTERNRLKYLLRKDKDALDSPGSEGLQTKQCPCCGKFISKLCFRCEHLYCKVETCPRKKKQRLNARMLEKMKGNKQKKGMPKRIHLSKQQRLESKRHNKEKNPEINNEQEDELSSESSSLDTSEVTDEVSNQVVLPNSSVDKKIKQRIKMTLSQSLKDSQIFFDQ